MDCNNSIESRLAVLESVTSMVRDQNAKDHEDMKKSLATLIEATYGLKIKIAAISAIVSFIIGGLGLWLKL